MEEIREVKKVCMIADGHQLYDDRMYWKQALSLQSFGYKIFIIYTSDKDEAGITEHGVSFYSVKIRRYFKSKFLNFFPQKIYHKTNNKILKIAKEIRADIYHLHDYQQHGIVRKLKEIPNKPKVIFDARIPIQKNLIDFSTEKGLKKFLVKYHARYLQHLEYKKAALYDVVLTVDNGLYESFKKNAKCIRLEVVYNFTNLDNKRQFKTLENRKYDLIYVGGLTELRGFYIMLRLGKILVKKNLKILLLGQIFERKLELYLYDFIRENHLEESIEWKKSVRFDEVSNYYNDSKIGLNILLPAKAHENIIQIKLFEYMNFGLPIITSDFGEMKNYVENNRVGFSVNPLDENEIIDKIEQLLQNKDLYMTFSKNGVKAVDEKYNWRVMEEKLLKIYSEL